MNTSVAAPTHIARNLDWNDVALIVAPRGLDRIPGHCTSLLRHQMKQLPGSAYSSFHDRSHNCHRRLSGGRSRARKFATRADPGQDDLRRDVAPARRHASFRVDTPAHDSIIGRDYGDVQLAGETRVG